VELEVLLAVVADEHEDAFLRPERQVAERQRGGRDGDENVRVAGRPQRQRGEGGVVGLDHGVMDEGALVRVDGVL